MSTCKIHQIYYSPESFAALDPGFIPLDNSNGRQDWMEYWPIRQYFLNNPVDEDELVGFFSPRFFEKTGLSAVDVYAHIQANPGHNVYLFNPYFHLAAWHPNIFVQAESTHQGISHVTNQILALMDIHTKVEDSIMSSLDTVYCNYFVATLDFWKKWLMICEFLFQLSEEENSISKLIGASTHYHRGNMPLKIFIIERIASIILNLNKEIKIKSKLIFHDMQYNSTGKINIKNELIVLDSLKIAHQATQEIEFLQMFSENRKFLITEHSLAL